MSTRFFTKEGENTLLKKFAGAIAHNPHIQRFEFRSSRHHCKGLLMLGDADKTIAHVRAKFTEDVQGAPYREEVEDGKRIGASFRI